MRKFRVGLYFVLSVLAIVSIYEFCVCLKFKSKYDDINKIRLEYELLDKEIVTYTELKNMYGDVILEQDEFGSKINGMKEKIDSLKKEIDDLKNSISEYNKKINSFS